MRRLTAALLAGALLASACSSGGPTEPVDLFPNETTTTVLGETLPQVAVTTTAPTPSGKETAPVEEIALADHSLTFRPASDSFAFENFGGGTAPADLTVNMARRLYGDEQTCSTVVDNKCTPYPVILQLISQANRSMQGGLCEGLAVLSLRLANNPATLASFQNVDEVAALVKEDPALLSELAYWYVTQFAVEVQQEASSYLEMHPTQLAEVLLRDFAAAEAGKPSTGYTVGIYSQQGGHAVTPYRVEVTANGYRIYIYDSNWPAAERWIDVDKDGWVYALAATNPTEKASAWGGSTGTMELTPMRSRAGPFSCGFCPDDSGTKSGTLLTVASTGDKQMALKIETESGDRLGYYDGRFVNEIEGATYRYLISGTTTADPVLVFLPPGVETFSADVEEIDVPTPEAAADAAELGETPQPDSKNDVAEPLEQEQEEPTQKFSLLLLNDEKSIQVEATIVEEEPTEEVEVSLIDFSDEGVSIAEVQDATVSITIDALAIELELDEGQTIEVVIAPEPVQQPGPVVEEAPQTLVLSIQDDQGEMLAEVEVDMTLYLIPEASEPDLTPEPGVPTSTLPPAPVVAPVVIAIVYDADTGVVEQEETLVEAWVASDAEYYQAIVEDNLEEVLGRSYVEELEEREEWVDEDETEARVFLSAVLAGVDDDYWEDEHWEETSYDEEWFEEEYEEEVWEEVLDAEDWFEEGADEWADNWAEEEELHILGEMGLEEWNETLMGPPPSETMGWEEEDWIAFDEEMDAVWEERMADPAAFEESLLEELGIEEWNPVWGPSPSESVEWTDEEWDDYDEQWAATEEARVLEQEGFDEWPEDWGPSPTESALWEESDWQAYDAEQQAMWEEEESWELDTPEEWDEWQEEFWPEDADWCDECEEGPWDDPNWDEPQNDPDWSGADEEAWILEQEGFDEWPEDWGPPPSETWDWTEEQWQTFGEEQEALWEEEWEDNDDDWGEEPEEAPSEDALLQDGLEVWPGWDNEEWSGDDEEAWILEQEGFDEWPEDWGPSPSESWDWTEDEWQAFDLEQQELWEDEGDPFTDPEDTGNLDEELLSEPDPPSEEEVDEEQVDEAEVPFEEGVDPHTVEGWSGQDEEGWILEQEGLTEWPEDWGPSPSESWDWEPEEWQAYDAEHGVPPPPEPEPEPEPEEEFWDPYDGCRGTSACESAPGGYDDWEDYDAANNPAYYDDWGTPPGGYVTWVDFTIEVEAGIVPVDVAEEYLPEEVQEAYIPVVVVAVAYYPTITYTNTNTALSETISTSTTTAQTGTATTTAESGILTHNSNDGHWHLATTTATTVTTTHVDTTTVVARAGSDMTSCTFSDGVQQSCSTVRGWSPQTTTVTVGDAYTSASTTTAEAVNTEEGCSEGGWRGMGDWCIVQSSSRNDRDMIQFSLTEVTSVRIDAESNLTSAQFGSSNEAADPYIYLNNDNNSDTGDHSGDTGAVTVGNQIETDDDGGRDCGSTCATPPSSAVDVDETPTITYCDTGGACSDGVPVIDNVSDQWDARIVRTDMAAGDYVVQASVYDTTNSGWYRLTIEEDN